MGIELILASKSPRRRELMKLLGHPYRCITSSVEENHVPGEAPEEHVTRLAASKAADVARSLANGIVVGSDTVVVLDGDMLGKPKSWDDALGMIMRLQGRTHTVFTGFALHDAENGRTESGYESTDVTMLPLTQDIVSDYLQTHEPFDKAGAYGIQGCGAILISGIKGCYFNVMGLPLSRLMAMLYIFSDGYFGYFGMNKD